MKYETLTLDNLFEKLAELAIYRATHYETNEYIYPKTNIDYIDTLLKKYIDLYMDNKFQVLDIEIQKDIILYSKITNFDEFSILCLIILKEAIYKAMTGDCLQILDMSKPFVSEQKYKTLKEELEKYELPVNSDNISIDVI